MRGCSDSKIDTSDQKTTPETFSSEPRIDTSKYEESVKKVRESLPENKRVEFDTAIGLITRIDLQGTVFFQGDIHGKTGSEVIAEADRLSTKWEKEELLLIERCRKEVSKFKILFSTFEKKGTNPAAPWPTVTVSVKNETEHAISKVYFRCTLITPGRTIPWLVEKLDRQNPGGIEPGEEMTFAFAQMPMSEWGKTQAPSDAVLDVEVERLDGPDGTPLFPIYIFGEHGENRLSYLRSKYQ